MTSSCVSLVRAPANMRYAFDQYQVCPYQRFPNFLTWCQNMKVDDISVIGYSRVNPHIRNHCFYYVIDIQTDPVITRYKTMQKVQPCDCKGRVEFQIRSDTGLDQQWFMWWLGAARQQAITWTNVNLSSIRSSIIHLRAMITQPSIAIIFG